MIMIHMKRSLSFVLTLILCLALAAVLWSLDAAARTETPADDSEALMYAADGTTDVYEAAKILQYNVGLAADTADFTVPDAAEILRLALWEQMEAASESDAPPSATEPPQPVTSTDA